MDVYCARAEQKTIEMLIIPITRPEQHVLCTQFYPGQEE